MTRDYLRLSLFDKPCDSKLGQRQRWDPEEHGLQLQLCQWELAPCPEFLGPTPQIRCVFLRKGHKSQTALWSLEQVSWVGFSRKSRNFPSTQNAPRRLNDSCRSACDPVRSENIPFLALEQVSLCPRRASQRVTAINRMFFFQGNQAHLSLEINGASRLNNTPTEGLLHLRLAEPLARVLLTIGLACSKYESNMFGMEIENLQCCTPKRRKIYLFLIGQDETAHWTSFTTQHVATCGLGQIHYKFFFGQSISQHLSTCKNKGGLKHNMWAAVL